MLCELPPPSAKCRKINFNLMATFCVITICLGIPHLGPLATPTSMGLVARHHGMSGMQLPVVEGHRVWALKPVL